MSENVLDVLVVDVLVVDVLVVEVDRLVDVVEVNRALMSPARELDEKLYQSVSFQPRSTQYPR